MKANSRFKSDKGQHAENGDTTMFDVTIDTKGFPTIVEETVRNPSTAEVIRRIEAVDASVKMTHSMLRKSSIVYDEEIGMWIADCPEGWLGLTANAHQQLTARQRSAGKDGVVGFTMAKTDKGVVALGSGSDQYGFIPFGETAKKVQRLVEEHDLNHTPREITISPAFCRVLYEVDRTEIAGDQILLGWGWQTSHDGSAALKVFDRVEREVCTNGMRGTSNDVVLRMIHRWGGMQKEHKRAVRRAEGDALPQWVANFLGSNAERRMKLKATESILEAIDAQIESGRFTIRRAEELAEKRYWDEEPAWTVTRGILDWLTNEDKAQVLSQVLDLKQSAYGGLTKYNRESALHSAVKTNLRQYGEEFNYSAWSIVQSLNDRPALRRLNFPVSLVDAMESLSNAVLTNWEQVAEAVTPVPTA